MEENFKDKYKVNTPLQFQDNNKRKNRENNVKEYRAPKGTAKRHKLNKRKFTTRVAALIMSAAIGIGGISLASNMIKGDDSKIDTVKGAQEQGVSIKQLGMNQETIEKLDKYNEYFEEFDKNDQYNLSEQDVLKMVEEIRELHFSVVKEKLATVTHTEPQDIELGYSYEKNDGTYSVKAMVTNEDYITETYRNNGLFGVSGDSKEMPDEMASTITQLEKVDLLKSEVMNDKISKVNAVKELKKIYSKLDSFAAGELVKDKEGNLSLAYFDKNRIEDKERGE